MIRSVSCCAALVILSSCVLSGCSPRGDDMQTSLTVAEAKNQTQDVENQIVELVPPEFVAEVVQQPQGVLLACDPHSVSWTGGTTITAQGAPDYAQILESIRQSFDGKDDYSSSLKTDSSGDPQLSITTTDDSLWIVGPMKDGRLLRITSSSPCFPTPDGMQPSDRY